MICPERGPLGCQAGIEPHKQGASQAPSGWGQKRLLAVFRLPQEWLAKEGLPSLHLGINKQRGHLVEQRINITLSGCQVVCVCACGGLLSFLHIRYHTPTPMMWTCPFGTTPRGKNNPLEQQQQQHKCQARGPWLLVSASC